MKTVSDLLRDADPVRHEGHVRDEERVRLRRIVVAAAPDGRPASAAPSRLRGFAVIVVAAVVISIAAVVSRTWLGGGATLQAAVRFEVRLAETHPASGLLEVQIAGDRRVYIHQEPVVTNDDISESQVVQRRDASGFEISVKFNAAGAEKMRQATAGHIGQPMAILIDGEVVAAPTVRAPVSAEARITGNFTKAEAERIANGMLVR